MPVLPFLLPKLDINPAVLGSLFQDAAKTTPVTATGQPIGAVVDQSGNGMDFLQATSGNRPTYLATGLNNLPAIKFTKSATTHLILPHASAGVLNALQAPAAAGDGYTFAFVIKPTETQGCFWAKGGFGAKRHMLCVSSAKEFQVFNNLLFSAGVGTGESTLVSPTGIYVMVYTYRRIALNTGVEKAYVQGYHVAQRGSDISPATFPALDTTFPWTIGAAKDLSNTQLPTDAAIARILATNTILGDADAITLMEELRSAYALPAFPVVDTTTRFFWQGDSITWGSSATAGNEYPAKANTLLAKTPPYENINLAVFGTTAAVVASNFQAKDIPALRVRSNNIMVIFVGTNDLATNGAQGQGTILVNRYVTFCSTVKAVNPAIKIVLVQMLPRSNDNPGGTPATFFESERQIFNQALVTKKGDGTLLCDAIVMLGSNLQIGQAGQSLSNAGGLWGDTVHPNTPGHAVIAADVRAVIASLLDSTPPNSPSTGSATTLTRSIRLDWEAIGDAATYNVWLAGVLASAPSTNSLIVTLTEGETRTYTIHAVDAAGNISSPPLSIAASAVGGVSASIFTNGVFK